MKVTSEFSENCPVRYTIKGKPLITTDKWRISYAGSNLGGDAMILNIKKNILLTKDVQLKNIFSIFKIWENG